MSARSDACMAACRFGCDVGKRYNRDLALMDTGALRRQRLRGRAVRCAYEVHLRARA